MKKISLFISVFLVSFSLLVAQNVEKIPLEKEISGLYYFNASINGVEEKFLFDTGASGVSINSVFFNLLKTKGVISQTDYLRNAVVVGINNTSVNVEVYNINSLVFDSFKISNIEVFLMPDPNAELIIGQSVFDKFGKVTIDNKNNFLLVEKNSISLDEIRLIPCSIEKIKDLSNLVQHLNSISKPKTISEEQNVPPPANAVARVKDGITIRYFETETEEIAFLLKTELEKLNEYTNIDIHTENMLPFIPNQIKGYLEIWIK